MSKFTINGKDANNSTPKQIRAMEILDGLPLYAMIDTNELAKLATCTDTVFRKQNIKEIMGDYSALKWGSTRCLVWGSKATIKAYDKERP